MYEQDERTVMTLDAGGTNFVFSAIKGCNEVVTPVRLSAVPDNMERCLAVLVEGFREVEKQLAEKPVAISFAFPGPADYEHGVIGDLPNFPAFPESGSPRRYKNLLGITLGTGFGGGVVVDGRLLTGDNGCGGDVWLMRNSRYPKLIAEESVSIRAVRRVYQERSGEDASALTPKDVFDIAEGTAAGNQQAAVQSFFELGEVAGDAIVHALDIVDGLVVIGGGVAGASKYIMPGIMHEMQRQVSTFGGASFPCLQMEVFNLEEKEGLAAFLTERDTLVKVPFSDRRVPYIAHRKVGIAVSSLGASRAISLGAYAFALSKLDNSKA